MKMTNMTVAMSNDVKNFNNAVDLFFGSNPSNKYWILSTLLLAKRGWLKIVDNFDGHCGTELARMDIELIGYTTISEEWARKGVHSKSVVSVVPQKYSDVISGIQRTFEQCQQPEPLRTGILSRNLASSDRLFEIAEKICSLSKNWFDDCSNAAFEEILYRIQRNAGRMASEFMQPKELTSLMLSMLSIEGGSVYNPYSGVCSFGINLPESTSYVAQELAALPHALGQLNMLFHGKDTSSILLEDSVLYWRDDIKFDYIVSNPPFRARCSSEYSYTDSDFLAKSASCASKAAIGVYPVSTCFANVGPNGRIMQSLVLRDLIESVVLLPEGIFTSTGISSVIIKTSAHKSMPGMVKLVDASSCFKMQARQRVLDLEAINSLLSSDEESAKMEVVSNDKISQNEYNLYPPFYLYKIAIGDIDGKRLMKLGDILSMVSLERATEKRGRKFSVSGLNPASVVFGGMLDEEELDAVSYRVVNEDVLLISRNGNFKVYYLVPEGNVYLRDIYRAFTVRTEVVDPQYLLSEMSKDYFVNQVARFGKGIAQLGRYMSIENLMECEVIVPSLEEQRRATQKGGEEALLLEIKRLEAQYEERLNDFMLGQRQRKHAVQQVLNEILPSVELVQNFALNNDGFSGTTVISKRSGKTMNDYLLSLKEQVQKVVDMVDLFTTQEAFGIPEEVDLYSFLDNYRASKNTNEKYQAVYQREQEDLEEGEESSQFLVQISRRDLTQMLDNLVANAVKHGFVDETRRDYQIEFKAFRDYSGAKPMAVIRVVNNGAPASASIPLDKVFTWGIGQGTGIGCWQVKSIAEHFGGSVAYNELTDDPDGFVCEFSICLPLIEK